MERAYKAGAFSVVVAKVFGWRLAIHGCVTALAAIARRTPVGALQPAICTRLLAELEAAAADEDLGGIFPTHLMRGGAADTARATLHLLDV